MSASLPMYPLQTREFSGRTEVWDEIRRKWLVLTPEEHVRQCLVQYFLQVLLVPKGLISLEKGIRYNSRQKRYDVVVYNRDGKPMILCECKAPNVPISEDTHFQWGVYQSELSAEALLLTNGRMLVAEAKDSDGKWKSLKLPFSPEEDGWKMNAATWIFQE